MASTELERRQRRARWAYERARLGRGLLGAAPMVLVMVAAALAAHRPASTIAFGALALLAGTAALWYGRAPQRAVLPGVAAGLVPLVASLVANHLHACGPDGCTSYCVPACAAGGVVAGLAVAAIGHRRRAGVGYWVAASALSFLTGAMGCACIGYSGVIGLALGFALGVAPGLTRWAWAR